MILHTSSDFNLIRGGLPDGHTIGVTSGCFDLLHYMHLIYLERCRRKCDFLIVGVDSDDLVRATKGPKRPNIPEAHRLAMVAALRCVDAVFIMDSLEHLKQAVEVGEINVMFKNSPSIYGKPAETYGAKLVVVPDVEMPGSTSAIIEGIVAKGIAG